jgi:hypothetical protein
MSFDKVSIYTSFDIVIALDEVNSLAGMDINRIFV